MSLKNIYKFFSTIKPDLYNRLGGDAIFLKSLTIFNDKIKANPSLFTYFRNMPSLQIKDHQKIILNLAFGKDIQYTNKEMKVKHLGLSIREAEFDVLLSELSDTLNQMEIQTDLISESVGCLEKYRHYIVAQSLYQRMGGEETIIIDIINKFFDFIIKDSELRHFYLTLDLHKIKDNYVKYLIMLFGGPHKYAGRDLRLCHQSFELNDRHFYLYKKYLGKSLRLCKLDPIIIEESLHKFENQRPAILNCSTSFDELGNKFGLRQIVEGWFSKLVVDPLIKPIFRDIDVEKLIEKHTEFLANELGCSEKYLKKDLKFVHAKYNLSDFHLDAFKISMKKTLEEQNVPNHTVRDVLWILEKHRREVCPINMFDIIGGESTVGEITNSLCEKIRKHKSLSLYFKQFNEEELKSILRNMLMYALGGPRAFRGKDIKAGHSHLKIRNADFEEMKKLVEKSMEDIGLVGSLIDQLMRVYEFRRTDVVNIV